MNIKYLVIPIVLLFGFMALLPKAQAVKPAPDGGYPGGNTAEGQNALLGRTTGGFNTAVGWFSLESLTTGSFNTGVGAGTLVLNSGAENTATGVGALFSNTTGSNNTANGVFALFSNGGSINNTACGGSALLNNTTGDANTANGASALQSNTTGNFNTAIGFQALGNLQTGSNNTVVGAQSGGNVTMASNVICIGVAGGDVNNTCFIGNIRDAQTQNADAIPVLIDSVGQLGTASSSARFKKDIKPMNNASQAVLALKPMTFHYNTDKTNTPQFGLIAEEVAEVNPELVVRDEKGEIYTVRYDAVNAMLLNEFLKAHSKVEELQINAAKQKVAIAQQREHFDGTIAELKKEIGNLSTTIKEQAAQIQKVSAQVKIGKAVRQVVGNQR